MRQAVRIIQAISHIGSGHFSAYVVLLMMLMVLVEVVTRYVLRHPLMVADEFGGYMLVAITFITLAYTWKEGAHVRIEFIVNRLPPRFRNWLRLITLILATAFVPVLIKGSYDLWAYSHQFHERSLSWLRTLLEWPQIVLLIGTALLFLELIAELIKHVGILREKGDES
ncbi:MAG: TRAP transporter small permease [Chloroflexi bacterium]|nr:TRAP transporter small permease [Chloroflexota bacterium]